MPPNEKSLTEHMTEKQLLFSGSLFVICYHIMALEEKVVTFVIVGMTFLEIRISIFMSTYYITNLRKQR